MENIFNDTFSKYNSIKDKFESLYIFIIHNETKEDVEAKLNKIIKIIDSIADSKKKNYLRGRIFSFKNILKVIKIL